MLVRNERSRFLWEYIDTLEHREIKKKRRRTKGTTIEIDAAEAMGGRE